MFVEAGSGAPVALAVVALGATPRLRRCLDALVAHASATDFEIVCVVNPDQQREDPDVSWAPPGVDVVAPDMNLGWAGGLHLARSRTTARYLAWIQDDMEPRDGWLDALVAAAEDHPRAACLGSLSFLPDGGPDLAAGGRAIPPRDVRRWPETDTTRTSPPTGYAELHWVTSKGMLVRTEAWDDVGGPDARMYPLGRVDMQFCTHVRTHGWTVGIVPTATVSHEGGRSAPGFLRAFMSGWIDDAFDREWGAAAAALAEDPDARPPHPCPGAPSMAEVERACGIEATRMVVPLARHAVATYEPQLARYESSKSWRWTAPFRALIAAVRRR